ncbi:MAG: hypothetical protein ABFC30_07475, partial [Proteiniphilum sp.]
VTMDWDIEEFLMPGTYKADLLADGYHIGSHSFTMQEESADHTPASLRGAAAHHPDKRSKKTP